MERTCEPKLSRKLAKMGMSDEALKAAAAQLKIKANAKAVREALKQAGFV